MPTSADGTITRRYETSDRLLVLGLLQGSFIFLADLVRTIELPRWIGFEAPEEFLAGYGLDHAEDFRHLPFIGSL